MTWLGFEGTPALKFPPISQYSFFFLPAAGRGPRRLLGNHVSPYLRACWLLQHPRTGWQGHGRGSLATSGGRPIWPQRLICSFGDEGQEKG